MIDDLHFWEPEGEGIVPGEVVATHEVNYLEPRADLCKPLSARFEFEDNLPVPSEGMCKLAIINAGMPRTASTLIGKVFLDAVKNLTSEPTLNIYWNWHHHVNLDKEAQKEFVSNSKYSLGKLGARGVLIAKSHEFYSPLLSACRKRVVVATHRHPVDLLNSEAQANWFQNASEGWGHFNEAAQRSFCWRSAAPKVSGTSFVDFPFERLLTLDTFRGVARDSLKLVAKALDVEPTDVEGFVQSIQERYWSHEANKGIPSKRPRKCEQPHTAPDECVEDVVRAMTPELVSSSWAATYGYTS